MDPQNLTVSIRPQVTVLSVLKHLEYETWFALAEFIDNAIDSFTKKMVLILKIKSQLETMLAVLQKRIIFAHLELQKYLQIILAFLNLEWE